MERDRDRLKEVHQTDLTEGRINEDFLDWLKTKGMSYLLFMLVALVAYMGIVRWRSHRVNYQTEAWTDLSKAAIPSSLEDVAEKYGDVGAVAQLARLRAAAELLTSVQTGKALGAEVMPPPPTPGSTETPPASKDLSDEDRTQYLDRADRLYSKVIDTDDHSPQKALLIITALTGRAAVAECKGQIDQAKQFYDQAAQRAEGTYPRLAEQARHRAATADEQVAPVKLISRADLTAAQRNPIDLESKEPVSIDPWAREILMPSAGAASGM